MNLKHLTAALSTAVLVLFTSGAVAVAETNFWIADATGRIVHQLTAAKPVVICLQGRKVVMQTQADTTNGLTYSARFFNLPGGLNTLGAQRYLAGQTAIPKIFVNDRPLPLPPPATVTFDGCLTVDYPFGAGAAVRRTIYPSTTNAVIVEEWEIRNPTRAPLTVKVSPARKVTALGEIACVWNCTGLAATAIPPEGRVTFATVVQARPKTGADAVIDVAEEGKARRALAIAAWYGPGRLETPEPQLDLAFALQKFHALECPIETGKGLITHNGSLTYSPGVWANDPVEYSSPLFPFFGDAGLNRAAMNMYRLWLDHCRTYGIAPFPGSFEGPSLKLTQRDRGDDAMVLYGLSKFLLFQGDRAAAEELWPLIEFSAASVQAHTTAAGIVASKTDEMEGRYPTGTANLSTSALAYGGYRLAATLARALGKPAATAFDQRAAALRSAIEKYFGAEIEGFQTYRYFKDSLKGANKLRGWILLPPAMGITERQETTIAALLSDQLWPHRLTGGDLLAQSGRPTEWGRETYYALRVLFKAGHTETALDLTRRVVQAQVFGPAGPYPDEDAIDMLCPGSLYPRVFTEGAFGIVPTGLDSFECTPWLPQAWPRMALRDLRAFGRSWDLVVERAGDQQKITINSGGKTLLTQTGPAGKTYAFTFPSK